MHLCFACIQVCVRVSGPMELELQTVMTCWVLKKSSQCSYPLSHLPSPLTNNLKSLFKVILRKWGGGDDSIHHNIQNPKWIKSLSLL